MPDVLLAILIFGPLAITILLKSNAAQAFFALCASFVVISFAGADIADLTKNLSFQINNTTLNLILLVAPLFLTLLIAKKSFSGPIKPLLNYAIAACTGVLLALVAVPLLSESARLNFANNTLWNDLQKIQTPAIAGGAGLSLLLTWFGKSSHHSKKHK
jgi:protein-S-isoprenylcysteine O-methyltransferase Ste14